jgi:hypothetical protein
VEHLLVLAAAERSTAPGPNRSTATSLASRDHQAAVLINEADAEEAVMACEVKYKSASGPEEIINKRMRNSGGEEADKIIKSGEGVRRVCTIFT